MKNVPIRERGQALILITLAAVGMIAMVGLAIDGAAKFSDQRRAQSAADTAALAGALTLTKTGPDDGTWKLVALQRAEDNGYTNNLVTQSVFVDLCTNPDAECGPYQNSSRHVSVIIDSYINTTFARVIGIRQLHNRVRAVTLWTPAGPTYGLELLKSLNPNPCNGDNGNIVFGGNGDITLDGGGAYINSGGGGCGMEFTGCGNLKVVNGGALSSIGDGNINIETDASTCAEHLDIPEPTYNYNGGVGYPFPPEMPERPEECDLDYIGSWSNNSSTQTSTMSPGRYYEFPPKGSVSSPVYDNIFMLPGVYCVESMVKLQDKHLNLVGYDVMIYIRKGGQFDVQGGSIHLEGRHPDSSYAGYLLIINSDFTGPIPNCTINGNSANIFVGTIFAPYCDFVFNGTNETGDPDLNYHIQVVAYTITLNGNSDINFVYDPGDVAQNEALVGFMR